MKRLHPLTIEKINFEHAGTRPDPVEEEPINWYDETHFQATEMLAKKYGRCKAVRMMEKTTDAMEEYIRNERAKNLAEVSGDDMATFTIEIKADAAREELQTYRGNATTYTRAMDEITRIVKSMKEVVNKYKYEI